MTIQYCSDLHLEFAQNKKYFSKNPITPKGDILILGGDIVPFAVMEEQADFFSFVADNFEKTFWLPGNHEYYHFDIANKNLQLNETIRNNVFLVNNQVVNLDKVALIVSTLWSHIPAENFIDIQLRMSDFSAIHNGKKRFTPQDYNELHQQCKTFISEALSHKANSATMVVTHHAPTFLNYPPKYKNDILNVAFATELQDLIERSDIDYWQFGHHHVNVPTFNIGKTQLITNQLGYVKYRENKGYKKDAVIEFL